MVHNPTKSQTADTAKNFGFIARMNRKDRIPANDTLFMSLFNSSPDKQILKSWLRGWDSANLSYSNVTKQINNNTK